MFSAPNFSSDTIFTLQENEAFLFFEDDEISPDWVNIEIHRSKFSQMPSGNRDSLTYHDFLVLGFVAKSDIILIESLPEHSLNDLGLVFEIINADSNMIIDETNMRYGLEVALSMSFVVQEMSLVWKGERIPQPNSLYYDLFNVHFVSGTLSSQANSALFKMYKRDDFYFIKQQCADGAGSYEITWVVKDGKIVQRLIDTI